MNRLLDCIQIRYGNSLGIFDNLINYWNKSIKNKMAAAKKNYMVVWVIFFSLFLDNNGHSLRLRGPAIN